MAWSKGTLGPAQGEGKQEVSQLSQRQGLSIRVGKGKGGVVKTPSFFLSGEAVVPRERLSRTLPLASEPLRTAKARAGQSSSWLQGSSLSLGIVGSLLP